MDLDHTQQFQLDNAPAKHESCNSQGHISLTQAQRDFESDDAAASMHEEAKGFISHSTQHRSARAYGIFGVWWVEAGACFLSMAALFAFVATLYPHQDRPLPQWPYKISVNSLISIYVIIIKAMVLFVIAEGMSQLKWRRLSHNRPLTDLVRYDEASRGPLGSLSLLLRLRLQHPLSSIGAFVTVFAVLTGPTSQQIIRYYDCNILITNSTASIPRTDILYGRDWADPDMGLGVIDPSLQVAINAGIFSPGKLVTPECDSGNCTFPTEYHTLGYCSSCTDISDQVHVNESGSYDIDLGGHMETCHRTYSVLTDTFFEPKNLSLVRSKRCVSATSLTLRDPEVMAMGVRMTGYNNGNITFIKGPMPDVSYANENTTGH
ncbi:MAG: hypothetical protein Q9167_004167 [Letrouitia subvulpina]